MTAVRSVGFGIFDHVDDAGVPPARQFEERLRLAELYDRQGFHAYHAAEHHGTPLGRAPSPNLLLAAMAQRTERLRLGALVNILPLQHPLRLIQEVCMLDHLSNGRLDLGVGRGASPLEAGFFGGDPDEMRARFEEALDVLLAGLTSETLSHHGRFYHLDEVPMQLRPLQQPHPPLWFGITTPERAAWAAARSVNVVALAPAAAVRPMVEAYREAWAALGHDEVERPRFGLMRSIVVAESDEEGMRVARHSYLPWRASLGHLHRRAGLDDPWNRLAPDDFREWHAAGRAYGGAPEGAVAFVARELDESGADYVAVQAVFGDMTFDEAARSVTLLGEHVLPAFAGA